MRTDRSRILIAMCAVDQARRSALRAAYRLTLRGNTGALRQGRVDRALAAAGDLAIAKRRWERIEADTRGMTVNRWRTYRAEMLERSAT